MKLYKDPCAHHYTHPHDRHTALVELYYTRAGIGHCYDHKESGLLTGLALYTGKPLVAERSISI